MRIHGHREGNITYRGLLEGGVVKKGVAGRGEIPNVDDMGMDAANHHGTCIHM